MSRISQERMERALQQLKTISTEDYQKIKGIAGIVKSPRSFIFKTPDMAGELWAPGVTMPVLMWQVRDDAWSKNPEDGQKTFDKLSSKEKELVWIEGTTRRFKDGYNWFGRTPEKVLSFFAKYIT